MHPVRLISRLDIKGQNLIKGIQLEGLRVIGDPAEFAVKYYEEGADELIYYDSVASLYNRNNLLDVVEKTARNIFIPLTVGGGVRSVNDVSNLLRAGADKISINTGAIRNKKLITEISQRFGAQCCVVEIQAKHSGNGKWEAYVDNGREHTGLDAINWAEHAVSLGAGEVLVTSIDREGTAKGFDNELAKKITSAVNVPVILSGGAGDTSEILKSAQISNVNALAFARVLHYRTTSIPQIRSAFQNAGIRVRNI